MRLVCLGLRGCGVAVVVGGWGKGRGEVVGVKCCGEALGARAWGRDLGRTAETRIGSGVVWERLVSGVVGVSGGVQRVGRDLGKGWRQAVRAGAERKLLWPGRREAVGLYAWMSIWG